MSPTVVETVGHLYSRAGVQKVGLTTFSDFQMGLPEFQIKRE
jgi:hypothetical protein